MDFYATNFRESLYNLEGKHKEYINIQTTKDRRALYRIPF